MHEFTGTLAAKLIQAQGMRRRPMRSLALGVGQLPVIHTTWVAISVVTSAAPTISTGQRERRRRWMGGKKWERREGARREKGSGVGRGRGEGRREGKERREG